jgi:hypothetical protein
MHPSMKIQRFFFLAVLATITLQSCFVNRYQKVQTTWEKAKKNTSAFVTPDSILNVNYSMWDSKSNIEIEIENRTDSVVYINPWYTFEIAQKTDTFYLVSTNQIDLKKYNGTVYLSDGELQEMLYYGEEIPIPPNGVLEIKSACINCYLQLDYSLNDPASSSDSIIYAIENTPFHFESRIGYAYPSDKSLRVVRHTGYVSKIDRYRFIWNIDNIPPEKKEDRAFYVHSQRPSILTWLGMVGLGVVYVLGQVSNEEE